MRSVLFRLLLGGALCASGSVHAQTVFIPDLQFRNKLNAWVPGLVDGLGYMPTNNDDLLPNSFTLNVNWTPANLAGLGALQGLKNLTMTVWDNVVLTTVPVLPPTLVSLATQRYPLATAWPVMPPYCSQLRVQDCLHADLPVYAPGYILLRLENTPNVTALPGLAGWVETVTVDQAGIISVDVDSVDSFQHISFNRCPALTQVSVMPTTLTGGVSLNGCPQVTSVSLGLVNSILLDSLPALTFLGPLSEGLTSLDLARLPQLANLPALPSTLFSLMLSTTAMTSLPPLPEGLDHVSANTMPLSVFPDLPGSLHGLGLGACPLLTAVPALPAGLTGMSLYELPLVTSVPTLPDGMTSFGLTLLTAVTELPSLPSALTQLILDSIPCTQLPDLPMGLTYLHVTDVPLVILPALPPALLHLFIDHASLTELPALPSALDALYLHNTPLNCLPMLPSSLYAFQVTNTNLSCQPNFPPNPPPVFPLCTLTSSTCPEQSAYISGTVYWDRNASGTREPNEPGLPHVTLSTSTEVYLTATDSAGHYTLAVQPGDLTVQPIPPTYTLAVLPATAEVTALALDTMISGIDFGVLLDTLLPDMSVVGWWLQAPRNDVARQFRVQVTNTGTTQAPAEVSLLLPTGVELVTCDQPPVINGNELLWQLDSLPMGAEVNFTCAFNAPLPILSSITLTAHIGPIEEDIDTTNNAYSSVATITGSYDPNDKTVRPALLSPEEGEDGHRLEYLIRFQNTGTAEALRVLVIDTLDPALDPLTVSFLGASHACQWFFRDGACTSCSIPSSSRTAPRMKPAAMVPSCSASPQGPGWPKGIPCRTRRTSTST